MRLMKRFSMLATVAGLCLAAGPCPLLGSGVAVNPSSVTLTADAPTAVVDVRAARMCGTAWRVEVDDPRVTVTPTEITESNAQLTIAAADFDSYYTARVTVEAEDGSCTGTKVYVAVTGRDPQTTWRKTLGEDDYELAYGAVAMDDGGVVVAGGVDGDRWMGGMHAYIAKFDSAGELAWQNTLETADSYVRAIAKTADGGFILAGTREYAAYLAKTDGSGNLAWARTYAGKRYAELHAVQALAGGGYVVAGEAAGALDTCAYIAETDAEGNLVWEGTLSGRDARGVVQTADGGYAVAGSLGDQAYIAKVDATGNLVWEKSMSPSSALPALANAITSLADGTLVICGDSETYAVDIWFGAYAAAISPDGSLLWQEIFGATGTVGASMLVTPEGRIVIAGYRNLSSPLEKSVYLFDVRMYLACLESSGEVLWEREFHTGSYAWAVAQATDGGFFLAGETAQDLSVLKTDANGNANS